MDPVTQGALGAAAAEAIAPRSCTPWAGVLGGLAGMAADLDVLIQSPTDPLLFLEYHRQVTHALAFIPVGGLLCALVAYPFVRRWLSFGRVYSFCLAGYATHGLLDGCTSYGTQLLWPFSNVRVAWNVVSVVDPLVTVPLLALVVVAAWRRRPSLARVACGWVLLYLLVGLAQRERAEAFGLSVAAARGHVPVSVAAKPAFGNLLLWKTFYEYDGAYYVDAARLGVVPESFAGESVPVLDVRRDLPWLRPGTTQARDVDRFRWFSDGFLARDPEHEGRLIDVRYSVVPNRIDALWGIEIDPAAGADAHARFFTSREITPEDRSAILRMLGLGGGARPSGGRP